MSARGSRGGPGRTKDNFRQTLATRAFDQRKGPSEGSPIPAKTRAAQHHVHQMVHKSRDPSLRNSQKSV